jgi:hypothetical protein
METSDNILHGKDNETPQKTATFRAGQGHPSQNHEDGQEHKDLEPSTRRLSGLRPPFQHNHRNAAGCHRCGFIPAKRARVEESRR